MKLVYQFLVVALLAIRATATELDSTTTGNHQHVQITGSASDFNEKLVGIERNLAAKCRSGEVKKGKKCVCKYRGHVYSSSKKKCACPFNLVEYGKAKVCVCPKKSPFWSKSASKCVKTLPTKSPKSGR